ncbi:hypothetical protein, partial [Streptococcus pneumoniae]|uniref:hypothetical protein n=1 Tax=Streptococcus pneumoniae TaxID=1313 RepID=UPI001CB77B26
EHSGLKDIYDGLGEVAKSLTQLCKHLSIQLSENEGDIERYCKEIKDHTYSNDIDIVLYEHSGLKDIYDGLGEVAKSLTQLCKHLSIQLSE